MGTIGENIAALRKKQGMTQEMLASAIGISTQSISKWENNTNMPDITLIPIIADIFQVSVDELFGRNQAGHAGKEAITNPGKLLDTCCSSLLKTMGTYFFNLQQDSQQEGFETFMEHYINELKSDNAMRTSIMGKEGVVYYHENAGGILLKQPVRGWHTLLENKEATKVLGLLCSEDFCRALAEIIKTGKTVFTLPSLCLACGIQNPGVLEEKLKESKLFSIVQPEIDGKLVTIYEFCSADRLFLLFAILCYVAEYAEYQSCYIGYCGNQHFYKDLNP